MSRIDYEKLNTFIASDVIQPFYQKRLEKLEKMKLKTVIKRKNPYLFKAKNINIAGDLAKDILNAFLSSQEETIFGDLLEGLAIHICNEVYGGYKAEEGQFGSVDLIFEKENKLFVVGIKSGPYWGNSDQIARMKRNFKKAKELLKAMHTDKKIIAVNGCMYGKNNQTYRVDVQENGYDYYKICGQEFWELISDDPDLYKEIIQPLDKEAKKKDEIFKALYEKKVNEMTKDIVDMFYKENELDWNKIIEFISKNDVGKGSNFS